MSGTRRLELNLDKVNNETIVALFSLSGMNKSSAFKPEAHIIFTLINSDNSRKEIRLISIAPPQYSKKWLLWTELILTSGRHSGLSSFEPTPTGQIAGNLRIINVYSLTIGGKLNLESKEYVVETNQYLQQSGSYIAAYTFALHAENTDIHGKNHFFDAMIKSAYK